MAYLNKTLQIRMRESDYQVLVNLWRASHSYSVSSFAREILLKIVLQPDCITRLRNMKIL